jgi:exodeoxyribonuclease VII large subunit
VQGELAPASIAEALEQADSRAETDVIILARGGGSLEDMQAFNSEVVARRIFQCEIPVVTGIGHEIDFTISDFVADQRAATPTAAAEMSSPDSSQLRNTVRSLAESLAQRTNRLIHNRQQTLDLLESRLVHPGQKLAGYMSEHGYMTRALVATARHFIYQKNYQRQICSRAIAASSPVMRVELLKQRVDQGHNRIMSQSRNRIMSLSQNLSNYVGKIRVMNPKHTLDRGYAIVQNKSSKLIMSPSDVNQGEKLDVTVSRGRLGVIVDNE